jgi:hypothetical protein
VSKSREVRINPSDRTLDHSEYATLVVKEIAGGFVRLGKKATDVLRRLEERPGFPSAQQHDSRTRIVDGQMKQDSYFLLTTNNLNRV